MTQVIGAQRCRSRFNSLVVARSDVGASLTISSALLGQSQSTVQHGRWGSVIFQQGMHGVLLLFVATLLGTCFVHGEFVASEDEYAFAVLSGRSAAILPPRLTPRQIFILGSRPAKQNYLPRR